MAENCKESITPLPIKFSNNLGKIKDLHLNFSELSILA